MGKVQLSLNLSIEGVEYPSHLMTKDNAKVSIRTHADYVVHKDKIEVDLSFDGQSHHCVFPYASIWKVRLMLDPSLKGMPTQEELDEEFQEVFEDCMPMSVLLTYGTSTPLQ